MSVLSATETLDTLLRKLVELQASDLHLKACRPPLVRVDGRLVPLDADPLSPEAIVGMLEAVVPPYLKRRLDDDMAIDFGYGVEGVSRFRASIFFQRGTLAGVFRRVPYDFPSLDEWGLPPVLGDLCKAQQGLVLITGPTGSGKSSTLAAMMREIAQTREAHIVTIEDPIEFLISDSKSSVSQREIGIDTPSFGSALRGVLRQDPDVIMVGEMRDEETIRTALTAAETGHLVFSTLHTNSAAQTIDRILSDMDDGSHKQLRQQLSTSLEAIVSMQLVPLAKGDGRIAAVEILRRSPQMAKLILNGEFEGLNEEIETSVNYFKMQSMNQSLAALVIHGEITRETAMQTSTNPGDLELLLRKIVGVALESVGGSAQGEDMADPHSDFSKILELTEVKKHYDDLQQRFREEIHGRDRQIADLRNQLNELAGGAQESAAGGGGGGAEVDRLRGENQRLADQLTKLKSEAEAKIDRLNKRLREVTAQASAEPAAADGGGRRGFFRR